MKTVFFVSTGRCGTKFLSKSMSGNRTYICHELEEPSVNSIMNKYYIPLAISGQAVLGEKIMKSYKLEQIENVLYENNCSTYIDTGHQFNYGMFPFLLSSISNIKLVRLRRNRYETALSFMTTPESNDIWNQKDYNGYYRWMMDPRFSICNTPIGFMNKWAELSRTQKVLWAIDEVERQWTRLVRQFDFEYCEFNFHNILKEEYDALERFIDVKLISIQDGQTKNSSKFWNRTKPNISLEVFKREDDDLQKLYKLFY